MRLENRLYKCVSWFLLSIFILTGCAPTRASIRINEHDRYGSLVYQRTFDEHGRPVFLLLLDRPEGTGDKFYAAEFEDNRPTISYEIEVVDEPDMDVLEPVSNFFYNLGMSLLFGLFLGLSFYEEVDEDEGLLSDNIDPGEAFSAGFVIGAGGGLLYTTYKAAEDTVTLLTKKNEVVVSETYFNYDETGRITNMTVLPHQRVQGETRTTRFFYEGEGTEPVRTETGNNTSEPKEPE